MLDRDQLEAFAAVVESLSFERAAEKLHVTRGAISQRVKALEETVGTSLLVRQKPLTLTAAGSVLLKHVAALRLLEADTFGQICARGGGVGTAMPLAVGVDAYSMDTWFGTVARRLMERETVELEVVVDDEDPAFPALVRGEVVGCVSTIARAASGCVATPIGDMSYVCVAAPAFMQRHFAKGFNLQAATKAPALLLGRRAELMERYLEAVFHVTVGRYCKHFLPSPAAQVDAILAGVGYGPLPEPSVRAHLASGALVDVLQNFSLSVTLYWHHWRTAPPICQAIGSEIVEYGLKELRSLRSEQPAALAC
jgi:LysR family transcriptional regulator (chromosome initiation inhibitor)